MCMTAAVVDPNGASAILASDSAVNVRYANGQVEHTAGDRRVYRTADGFATGSGDLPTLETAPEAIVGLDATTPESVSQVLAEGLEEELPEYPGAEPHRTALLTTSARPEGLHAACHSANGALVKHSGPGGYILTLPADLGEAQEAQQREQFLAELSTQATSGGYLEAMRAAFQRVAAVSSLTSNGFRVG